MSRQPLVVARDEPRSALRSSLSYGPREPGRGPQRAMGKTGIFAEFRDSYTVTNSEATETTDTSRAQEWSRSRGADIREEPKNQNQIWSRIGADWADRADAAESGAVSSAQFA